MPRRHEAVYEAITAPEDDPIGGHSLAREMTRPVDRLT
jgi:hypothetical protein